VVFSSGVNSLINNVNRSGTNPRADLSYGVEGDSAPARNDAVLVSASQQGDLEAFEQLVAKHQKRMLNVAYRLTNDYDDACEVVQDAFLSAYKSIKSFRGDAKFTTWLTAITVNLSKNRLKQMRSRKGHEAYSLDEQVETDDGRMKIDPPSKEPSVLDRLEARDVKVRVQDCIKALEPDFREILVLRDLQDFSYEEIGGMLKVREGTVKSRLFRAREMVKDCLKKVMGEL
jgi:RNA polymerase sigma-70 factor, ECF subfamily